MDSVAEIKARLPIDELVRQYCALQKKGRNFVALCPFHNDSKPSLLVSPDKGIAYCFPCQKGGDIFSFYQLIEGVDFRQAIKDLAERTGVTLVETVAKGPGKDERDRLRECLQEAHRFYRTALREHPEVVEYLQSRGVSPAERDSFELGFAPENFATTYDYLLKAGFSRSEIVSAGLGIQRELAESRVIDRFHNRVMFPIHDVQSRLVGFGGRTLAKDDSAKYLNSAESILYRKSAVLYGLNHAKDAIRQRKSVILVEGYFDVLACHRVGARSAVGVCGTALTTEHCKLLKRYAETIILCLDQDEAGRKAAERAFLLLTAEGLAVNNVTLPGKDPADAALENAELLRRLLDDGGVPYLDLVLHELSSTDLTAASGKRAAVARLAPLLNAFPGAVERAHYVERAAALLGVSTEILGEDLRANRGQVPSSREPVPIRQADSASTPRELFTSMDLALGLFLLYPRCRSSLQELIAPEGEFAAALHQALRKNPDAASVDALDLTPEYRERASVLLLFCEEHGFGQWAESMVLREIRKNAVHANREIIRAKQQELARKLADAHRHGRDADAAMLQTQFEQLLKLGRMAK